MVQDIFYGCFVVDPPIYCQHQEKQRKFTPLPGNAAVAGALRNNLTHDLQRSHKQQLDSFKIHSSKVGVEGYNSVCHAPKKDENT